LPAPPPLAPERAKQVRGAAVGGSTLIPSLDGINALIIKHETAGVSAAAITDGAVSWTQAWGVRDASTGESIGPDTLFQAGSISKSVTAVAALRLVESGAFDLDDDVERFGIEWPTVEGWRARVTPRQLLSHMSGLAVWGFPGYSVREPIPSADDVIHGRGNTPAVVSDVVPGLSWMYSGGGYTVLQELVCRVADEPFADLVERLVLEPAGMTRSTFAQPLPESWHDDVSVGHIKFQPVEGGWHAYPERAAAGLWTTPRDLATFCLALVKSRNSATRGILSPSSAKELLSGQRRVPTMGLGLFLSTTGTPVFGHAGGNHGYVCQMACTYDGHIGAVAMTNSIEGMPVATEIVSLVGAERDVELPPSPAWAQKASSDDDDLSPPPAGGLPRAGRYELDGETAVVIEHVGEGLQVAIGQQRPLLFEHGDGYWQARTVRTTLRFVDGGLVLSQHGRDFSARQT
jgi:CubicO group peptidase (beta-lactamase class C family)